MAEMVVPSAKLYHFDTLLKRNKSLVKILRDSNPKIDPSYTADNSILKQLFIVLIILNNSYFIVLIILFALKRNTYISENFYRLR